MSDKLYTSVLSNPLNVLLLFPILYLLSLVIFPPTLDPSTSKPLPSTYNPDVYNWLPATHPEVLVHRKFTPKDLSVFDGKDGGRICLAILKEKGKDGRQERTVFDVSSGRGFYGPGEWFDCWTGRRVDLITPRCRWGVWEFCW